MMTGGNTERGSATIFAIGCFLVAAAVAGVAVDGSRAFILRRSLQAKADAAVLAGGASLDEEAYRSSGGREIRIDSDRAKAAVGRVLLGRGIRVTSFEDGTRRVEVTVESSFRPLFLGLIGLEEVTVRAAAAAAPFPGSVP